MSIPIPPVDDRKFEDIVKQAFTLAQHYCPEWKPGQSSARTPGPATALVYLFARLMEIIITRLNRVPEKYYLAFLDYIGARLRPPSPASVLLQFTLSTGADNDLWIPAGAKTAAEETRFNEEQVFETLTGMTATPVQMMCRSRGTKDEADSFYLGFDRPFSDDSHSIYFPVPENDGESRSLLWEYSAADGWRHLQVKDRTRNLSTAGHAAFIGPVDFAPQLLSFHEEPLYWFRVRLNGTGTTFSHLIEQAWLNTVRAENVETVTDELLGSSDGSAGQEFQLNRFPVLPGRQVWVTEREIPVDADLRLILNEEGEDAVVVERDEKGTIKEVRIRWHEVDNFFASGPQHRHYQLESASGRIRFGDGTRGLVPPMGRDNIRCSAYRTGGGVKGNVGVGKITELKTSLPFIDSVTNVEPAAGGTDVETLEEIMERGPFMLKHRDRVVTAEDFEWMMKEAPGDIAVSKCLPVVNGIDDDIVNVIIIPESEDPKPEPDQNLIRQVENFLYQRSLASLVSTDAPRIKVTGPGYIKISTEADIVPQHIDQAGIVEERVIANLENFFHPLRGGPENKGWPFGRDVHLSEVMQVLQNTAGVDFVKSLRLNAVKDPEEDNDEPGTTEKEDKNPARIYLEPNYLVYSGKHNINMVLE